jgi:tetratricopeptide (TPR) repeat protein
MSDTLDEQTHAAITQLTEAGDRLVEQRSYDQALDTYHQALDLVPEPITDWEAATWILTAIGETQFFKKDFIKAREALQQAMHCPDAIGNPFIHLRLGQVQFELGDLQRARDELARAYMGAGDEIFDGEDPKYLALVRQALK